MKATEGRKTDGELYNFIEPVTNQQDVTPKLNNKWAALKKKIYSRNWNKEFQDLLLQEDSKEKYEKLRNLGI